MKLIGMIRLGRDAEQRFTTGGDSIVTISGAWNYGKKDAEGKRPTQWAELMIWGDRGEKLLAHLTKRKQLFVVADEVRVETFDRRDGGKGSKLVGRLESLEFVGDREDAEPRQSAPAPRAAAPRPAPKPSADDDFDVPF